MARVQTVTASEKLETVTKIKEDSDKMVTIMVESFSDDILKILYSDLTNKDEWDEECEICRLPALLHHDQEGRPLMQSCEGRRSELSEAVRDKRDAEILNTGSKFSKRMAPMRKAYRQEKEKRSPNNEVVAHIQRIIETTINGDINRSSKLTKPTKVPTWGTGMKYKAY